MHLSHLERVHLRLHRPGAPQMALHELPGRTVLLHLWVSIWSCPPCSDAPRFRRRGRTNSARSDGSRLGLGSKHGLDEASLEQLLQAALLKSARGRPCSSLYVTCPRPRPYRNRPDDLGGFLRPLRSLVREKVRKGVRESV